jgi:hypothetical protein
MRIHPSSRSGLSLPELSITAAVVGVFGLVVYSLLNIGTVLGAKNTATNTAHQQARVAMLKMIEDLHAAISLPKLEGLDAEGKHASGISFQQWGSRRINGVQTVNGGPHKIRDDAFANDDHIHIIVSGTRPVVGQRVIIPTHQIEKTIVDTSGGDSNFELEFADTLGVDIKGTGSTIGDVVCYITDRCSYNVVEVLGAGGASLVPPEYKLQWTTLAGTRDIATSITNPRPFSIPTTPAGALYYRFVAAIDLSTSDSKYSRRGYKSANILLNGQVPFKTRITTYQ